MKFKKIFNILSYCIVFASSVFFIFVLSRNIPKLPSIEPNVLVINVSAAIILYLVIIAITGYIWYLLLRAIGEKAIFRDAITVFTIAQFAKYIPGNIAHQVSRVTLSQNYGMKIGNVIFSMTMEAGWAIASSSFLAVVSIFITGQKIIRYLPDILSTEKLFIVTLGAISIPLFIGYVIRNTPGPFKRLIKEDILKPDIAILALCFLLNVVAFLLMGYIAYFMIKNLFYVNNSNLFIMTSVFSFAWIAGFITPGAPAGLGVREAIIVAVLTPIYGAGASIGLTIAMRIVTILGDFLAFITGFVAQYFRTDSFSGGTIK
jgi:uncharacterized membrane protein YbhN (UPF0104 family)